MYWYFYVIYGFLLVWLLTMLIFLIKKRFILFYVASLLPIGSVIIIVLFLLVIVLLPAIYLGLFLYSLIVPSYEVFMFGKKIRIK